MTFRLTITKNENGSENKVQISGSEPFIQEDKLIAIIDTVLNGSEAKVDQTFTKLLHEQRESRNRFERHTSSFHEVLQDDIPKDPEPEPIKAPESPAAPKQEEKKIEEVKSRPRAIQLLGSGGTGFPIADKYPDLKISEKSIDETDKMKQNVQVAVRCQLCGQHETRFVYSNSFYCKCPGCNEKLWLEKAVADGSIEVDSSGNRYIARRRFKTAKELWEEKNRAK